MFTNRDGAGVVIQITLSTYLTKKKVNKPLVDKHAFIVDKIFLFLSAFEFINFEIKST